MIRRRRTLTAAKFIDVDRRVSPDEYRARRAERDARARSTRGRPRRCGSGIRHRDGRHWRATALNRRMLRQRDNARTAMPVAARELNIAQRHTNAVVVITASVIELPFPI